MSEDKPPPTPTPPPLGGPLTPPPRGEATENIPVSPAGQVIGSYRILGVIGAGGMGRVYLAEHIRLERKVALKLLLPELAGDAGIVRRFFDEARAVNKIDHENIVQITDFCEEGPYKYYIMEYLEGENLEEVLRRGQGVPLEQALRVSLQTAAALSAVHEAGFVHRDLKPANIFVGAKTGRHDVVKLLDFGVAKSVTMGHDDPDATQAGVLFGSPGYIAPEYAGGHPADYRADIYAFGVVLFEMLTGRRVFAAATPAEALLKHAKDKPRSPRKLNPDNVPEALDELILQCLAKRPERRPQSMQEIAHRLRDIAAAAGVDLVELSLAVGGPPPAVAQRTSLLSTGLKVAAVAAAAAAIWVLMGPSGTGDLRGKPNGLAFDPVPATFEVSSTAQTQVAETEPVPIRIEVPEAAIKVMAPSKAAVPQKVVRKKAALKKKRARRRPPPATAVAVPNKAPAAIPAAAPMFEAELPPAEEGFDLDDESLFDPYSEE